VSLQKSPGEMADPEVGAIHVAAITNRPAIARCLGRICVRPEASVWGGSHPGRLRMLYQNLRKFEDLIGVSDFRHTTQLPVKNGADRG